MSAFVAAMLIMVMLFVPALADIATYSRARADAQNAADAAALAAVQEVVTGGDPRKAAAAYAGDNGACISTVSIADRWVVVTVEKECNMDLTDRLGIEIAPVSASGKAEIKDYDEPEY